MTAPRLALITAAVVGIAFALTTSRSAPDEGADIARALRSGQWQLAQRQLDTHRERHGRSAETARWQTALDLAARGPQVAREAHAPNADEAPTSVTPDATLADAGARADSDAVTVVRDDRGIDAPPALITR